MRTRAALLLSFLLNLALGYVLFNSAHHTSKPTPLSEVVVQRIEAPGIIKTNLVVRRLNFTWSQIETNDYRAYIQNLRAIACPESTIRDIIVADVTSLYERKRLTEIVTPEQQWWRSNPDGAVAQAAMQQAHSLELEKRALLDELLGSHWQGSSNWEAVAFNTRFDGPILGELSAESKEALRVLEMRNSQQRLDYISARQSDGEPVDPGELKRLQDESRAELAKILSPAQVEEYLLRYSDVAQNMRRELQGFEVSPEEFRKIFRGREELDQQSRLGLTGTDVVSVQHQQDMAKQREAGLEEALGSDRFRLYQYTQDPLFRDAQSSAQEMGIAADMVLPIFEINRAAELERQRIQGNVGLSSEDQAAAWASAAEKRDESLRQVLGSNTYKAYRQRSVPSIPGSN